MAGERLAGCVSPPDGSEEQGHHHTELVGFLAPVCREKTLEGRIALGICQPVSEYQACEFVRGTINVVGRRKLDAPVRFSLNDPVDWFAQRRQSQIVVEGRKKPPEGLVGHPEKQLVNPNGQSARSAHREYFGRGGKVIIQRSHERHDSNAVGIGDESPSCRRETLREIRTQQINELGPIGSTSHRRHPAIPHGSRVVAPERPGNSARHNPAHTVPSAACSRHPLRPEKLKDRAGDEPDQKHTLRRQLAQGSESRRCCAGVVTVAAGAALAAAVGLVAAISATCFILAAALVARP
jgi:hypothetical protein